MRDLFLIVFSWANGAKQVFRFSFFLTLFFGAVVVNAQDFKRQFKNARTLFDEKQYNLAMEAFKPLIVYDRNNPYPEYASFYYAVSAYQQGYGAVAKDMFLQIRKLYPDWDQLSEVNYWLAKIYFDQREYFQGLLMLREINNPALESDVASLKQHYFAQISDAETLRMALEDYPNDKIIARSLAAALAKDANQPGVMRQFDSLVSVFQFNRDEFNLNLGPVSFKKDKYVVSLLMPFLANTLEPTPAPKVNQQILDMYQGIVMARDTLEKQGIHIDLRLYDTESNDEKVKDILALPELKSSDLIVGPIFNNTEAVKEFSLANQIVMVNPVSRNSDYVRDNPFAILFQPSFETIGRRGAEWVAENIRNKNCIVYFGDTPRDSIQAFGFMKRAKELNLNIVLAEEHRRETAGTIISTLATPTEFDEFKNATQYSLKRDSIGSIYVASDNQLIFSKVNSSVTTRGDSIIVVGSEAWISPENTSVSLENYERNHVALAAPRYCSEQSQAYNAFRRSYLLRHGVLPGSLSILGYEFMLYAGKALARYGTYFLPGIAAEGFQTGTLYQGFDYTQSQDNQYVPFVQFRDGELVVVNSRK